MSYLDHASDPRRRAKAIIAVGTIHAVLAYGLVTGLGVDVIERLTQPPLVGEQIPLPPPPPPKPDTPPETPIVSTPVAPVPPIPLQPVPDPKIDPFEDLSDPVVVLDPTPPAPPLPPSPPAPNFTPKRAVPSNGSSGWITNDDYPRRALIDEAEGSVAYRLVVGTNGRGSSCELTRPSGNRAPDDADHDREAAGPDARAKRDAAPHQVGAGLGGVHEIEAGHHQHDAERGYSAGAIAVGDGARDHTGETPKQVRDGHGSRERRQADAFGSGPKRSMRNVRFATCRKSSDSTCLKWC